MDAAGERPAAPKRLRRSTSQFLVGQRSLRVATASAPAAAAPCESALVLAGDGPPPGAPPSYSVLSQEVFGALPALSQEAPPVDVSADDLTRVQRQRAGVQRQQSLAFAAAAERKRAERREEAELVLNSSESVAIDLCLRTELRLSTSHDSFRWLWRLPMALRCPVARGAGPSAKHLREAVVQVCQECVPRLLADPDSAQRWMEKIAGCLTWHQLEGPRLPSGPPPPAGGAASEDASAWRKVEEWDEAFRSLETFLRQGLIPSFVVTADRFSVTVVGDGAGYAVNAAGGGVAPTREAPCAVLCPSNGELRAMLQENHVPFEVAEVEQHGDQMQEAGMDAGLNSEVLADLRGMRNEGHNVKHDNAHVATPASSALLFRGAWRVHAMLDVLRQHFLGSPVARAARESARLPRLAAPTPFANAAPCFAEVVSTQSLPGAAGCKAGGALHVAELRGCFFPGQSRRLLELLRVLLPSFSCELRPDRRHSTGINAFTKLGMRRIETVECDGREVDPDGNVDWNWAIKLGA